MEVIKKLRLAGITPGELAILIDPKMMEIIELLEAEGLGFETLSIIAKKAEETPWQDGPFDSFCDKMHYELEPLLKK